MPLTNEMKSGSEPLRTFGDLKQFLELKPNPRREQRATAAGKPESSWQDSPRGLRRRNTMALRHVLALQSFNFPRSWTFKSDSKKPSSAASARTTPRRAPARKRRWAKRS